MRAQLTQALRHIDDAFVLDHLPLARLPALVPHVRCFAGRTATRGRGLQQLLRVAAERITESRPEGTFETFVRAYIAGLSVAAAAQQAGVTREHASRVFHPRLVGRMATEIRQLLRTPVPHDGTTARK